MTISGYETHSETADGIIFDQPGKPGKVTNEYWEPLRALKKARLQARKLEIKLAAEVKASRDAQDNPVKISPQLIGKRVVCALTNGELHMGTLSHLLDPATGRSIRPGSDPAGTYALVLAQAVPPIEASPPIIKGHQILSVY